jgi:hypothetical protein
MISLSNCTQLSDGTFRAAAFVGETFNVRLDVPGDAISSVTNSSKPSAGTTVTFTTTALNSTTNALDAAGVYVFAVSFASGIVATLNVVVFPVAALSFGKIATEESGGTRDMDARRGIFKSLARDVDLTAAPTILASTQWWTGTLLVGGKTGTCVRLSDYGASH